MVAFGQIPAGCAAYKHLGVWVERLQSEAFSEKTMGMKCWCGNVGTVLRGIWKYSVFQKWRSMKVKGGKWNWKSRCARYHGRFRLPNWEARTLQTDQERLNKTKQINPTLNIIEIERYMIHFKPSLPIAHVRRERNSKQEVLLRDCYNILG